MNAPAVAAPTNRKKRILLIASHAPKRDLRARVLRQLGVEVDCAADISEARSLWQADSYNLVLLDVKREPRNVEEFCREMQGAKPPQRIAYLVGKPEYLGAAPGADETPDAHSDSTQTLWSEVVASLFLNSCELLPRRYGFVEASWRIAATRSLKDPRPKNGGGAGKQPWSWAAAIRRHASLPVAATAPLDSYNPDSYSPVIPDKETS